MKPIISFILLVLSICVVSCDKLPKNGDLDGMWQLMFLEKTGEQPENVKSEKVYYSFQLDLVELNNVTQNGGNTIYYAYFKHSEDSLFIRKICFPSANETAADNNIELTEADIVKLSPWGIYTLNPRFKIWKLDSDAMILQSEETKLTFRKF